tara:strand:- start:253 stop:717 length:465 start_codon:yes stop_codon:yes gene_type:complete
MHILLSIILVLAFLTPQKAQSQNQKTQSYEKSQEFFSIANNLAKRGDYLNAVENYHKAIKANPLLPAPHYNLANVFVAMGKLDDAVNEYKLAIKINPMIPDYHRNLGFAYALMKKGDLAKKKYDQLKKLDSTQADLLMEWIKPRRGQVGSRPPN